MKTDELVDALVADLDASSPRLNRAIILAFSVGALVIAALFIRFVGLRADIANVYATLRFLTKFVVTLGLALPALGLTVRLARPEAEPDKKLLLLAIAPAILFLAVALELHATSPGSWWTRLAGVNARYCVTLIPALAALPLACLLYALRRAAPSDCQLAGLLAGLAAGGVGAAIYATHCMDDSPLFLATWYPIGVGVVALAGAWLGPRVLDW